MLQGTHSFIDSLTHSFIHSGFQLYTSHFSGHGRWSINKQVKLCGGQCCGCTEIQEGGLGAIRERVAVFKEFSPGKPHGGGDIGTKGFSFTPGDG